MGLDSYWMRMPRVETSEEASKLIDDYYKSMLSLKKDTNDLIGADDDTYVEEVLYMRKANQVHSMFVNRCGGGVDDCSPILCKEEELYGMLCDVEDVLADHSQAERLVPTCSGFFFGSTDYDEWYFDDLKLFRESMAEILSTTDFSKQSIVYHASW